MTCKALAKSLVQRFNTRNPFAIADALGYLIIYAPLVGVRGFYQYIKRCHIIYLDTGLEENEARFVCAHELGHSLLHKGCNRIFMDTKTHLLSSRYEQEADRFAVDLLFSDDDFRELMALPTHTAADCLGIPEGLVRYRMETLLNTMAKQTAL